MIGNSHGSIVATNTTFVSVGVPCITIPVDVYFGIISYLDIYWVGGDAIMITVCGCQSRIVRDINSTLDGFIFVILVRIRINIDAAATALSLFTRVYRNSVHKPADGEVRIILNAQVTAVVDAQAAAARVVRLEVRNIHDGALVQNQCAGAKEYCRDIGIFFIGVAGVRSRIDSQLAAVLDGHFAAGRIDTLLFQR